MTEPENFEDLFADLYEDNDAFRPEQGGPTAPTASEPGPSPSLETQQPADDGPMQSADKPSESNLNQDLSIESIKDHQEVNNETGGGDGDEDDVDFNLGGQGNSAAPASHQESRTMTPPFGTVHKASAKDDGKMFIGGLNWETTDRKLAPVIITMSYKVLTRLESLRDYFSQFGDVVECTVMRDSSSGRSRGFGFLTFKDAKTVNVVMVKEHFLDGKIIDPKRAIPRDEQEKTSKIFAGGVSQETTDQEFRDYFAQFGRVVDATLMMDKDTGRPRGFGFVTFENEAGVDACINVPLELHGKPVEVKKAQPRGNIREEEEAAKRNKFRKNDEQSWSQNDGPQQPGTNGMSPQVMAQYFQRMQQYFAMMQSQMAMNRGMQMNPAMWQNMMQMQQMQQQMMGRGGVGVGGHPQNMMANANPQMMQQMQQQQQQQLGGAGAGGGGGSDAGNFGGFQQPPPQGPSAGCRGGGRGGGYGSGGGGYGGGGGGGGGPTSWEGMYDDVPQPGSGGFRRGGQGTPDPQNAPPANAPTGPKNAGRPGANYRGGGRRGSRGFHPYAR